MAPRGQRRPPFGHGRPPLAGAFAFTMSLNFPTSYYFRGIAQSNAGFLFQPYLELKANIYEGAEKDVVTGGKGFELWGGLGIRMEY